MGNKIIKVIKNAVSIVLLGAIFINVTTIMSRAEDLGDTWYVCAMDEVDESLSKFKEKSIAGDLRLYLIACDGIMRVRAVGALRSDPTFDYADCSIGRTETVSHYGQKLYTLGNTIVEWNYTYAGVLATSVVDSAVSAQGYFLVN